MKKRQRKKNEKKYLPIFADEFALLTMTDEERKKAHEDYLKYRKRYAFRKKYNDLKRGKGRPKSITYFYPLGSKFVRSTNELARRTRKNYVPSLTVTQSLSDIQ